MLLFHILQFGGVLSKPLLSTYLFGTHGFKVKISFESGIVPAIKILFNLFILLGLLHLLYISVLAYYYSVYFCQLMS